ncbi:MAG TPA: replication-associated recombination protein A, partial [Opitutales bacterium]|nr:replication-associated recombination protein A [Opitutales bacterium]
MSEQSFLFPSEHTALVEPQVSDSEAPLAWKLRPHRFEDLLGQPHLTAPEGLLVRLVRSKKFVSLLFYGPPG